MMTRIEQSVEVNAPAPTVYNQLTQFEDYPRFMEDIEEVRQLDDTHLHWRAKLNSHDLEWDAEIMEQVPDQLIAWRNTSGPIKVEKVEVRPLDQNKSKVTMTMEYEEPQQQAQGQESDLDIKIAEIAAHDLMYLKRFIESRGRETGAWRGEVRQGKEVKPPGNGAGAQGGAAGQEAGQQASAAQGKPNGQQAGGQQTSEQQPGGQQAGGQQTSEQQPGGQQAGGQQTSEQQPGSQQTAGQQAGAAEGKPDGAQAGAQQSQEQQPSSQQAVSQAAGTQQPGQQLAGQQASAGQAGGQVGTQQQQGLQAMEQDPMLAAMTSMNPQSWLPNILHAWEEPFVIMRKMTEDMDQIFERFVGRPMYGAKPRQAALPSGAAAWSPPVEVAQRDNQLVILAELPGVKQEDVHVEIKNGRLVIEGDRREEPQREGQGIRRSERSYGHFCRTIALPEGINPEQASASMRDGVLEVTVPVQQQMKQQGRHLDIRSAG
jgi:HSP20 family molecular chaperone IbpA/ribosome-associated toxin RatA of RatAB toxin-antitoxin module